MPPPRIRTVEGSCWGCKERRVMCDLTMPTCDKCAKTGRRCDYGRVRLRWTDCVASRGRLAGKKIPLYRPPILQRNQDHRLLYFERELLPRFNLSNTVPLLDLNVLSKDPVLLQSALAVANAHETCRDSQQKSLVSVSRIQDRNKALRVFREHLTGSHTDETNSSLFIANVLLCILDGIVEPCADNLATHHHLVGGKAILSQWGGVHGIFQLKYELPILMLSIFASMDLTHTLLIGDKPYFEPSSWSEFGNAEAWWGNVKPDDDFLLTMSVLSQLGALGHGVRRLQKTIPIGTLLSIQMTLEQQASRQEAKDDSSENAHWVAFCSVYRFMASIYLYRALSGLEVCHTLVQNAVTACMEVIGGPNLTAKHHHCILFPLLIVGSHCTLVEHRIAVRRSIGQTATYLSFEGLRSLESFLEKRWVALDEQVECRELNWWEYYGEIANMTCLF